MPILVDDIHVHSVFKTSSRSERPLAVVEIAFCSMHTFSFRLPLMPADSCTRLEQHLVVS